MSIRLFSYSASFGRLPGSDNYKQNLMEKYSASLLLRFDQCELLM